MIGVKCPTRLSLAGGGTDTPAYFNDYGSKVISLAINQYSYVFLRKTPTIFDYHSRAQYSKIEEVMSNSQFHNNGIRGTLEFLKEESGIEVSVLLDLPAQAGLGGSSSFVSALLLAVHTLNGRTRTQAEIASEAVKVERGVLAEPGGLQDSFGCCISGAKTLEFTKDGTNISPLDTSPEFLSHILDRSVLLYTGSTKPRKSFEIAASYNTTSALQYKHQIRNLADEMIEAFKQEDEGLIGRLLHKSWMSKRAISPMISNPQIDSYYEKGISCRAVAGKLLGAGQSGFMYFLLQDKVDKDEFAKCVGLHKVDFELDTRGVCVL